ncbi:MAG: purine-nucleoside phosphorylase [Clostridia bacterium]
MSNTPTIHNNAKYGDIAPFVIMPGDPKRAEYIAENFLEDVYCYNDVRGILGFSGTYKGVRVSVQGSGMGNPSMGIYSYELFKFYGVSHIIRIGTCGTCSNNLKLKDLLLVNSIDTDSNYNKILGVDNIYPSKYINDKIIDVSNEKNVNVTIGKVFCSDVFYENNNKFICDAVEMESTALFSNAIHLNKEASVLLSVTDNSITGECMSSFDRENNLNKMITLALDTFVVINND